MGELPNHRTDPSAMFHDAIGLQSPQCLTHRGSRQVQLSTHVFFAKACARRNLTIADQAENGVIGGLSTGSGMRHVWTLIFVSSRIQEQ
jgi:hypothetical protein